MQTRKHISDETSAKYEAEVRCLQKSWRQLNKDKLINSPTSLMGCFTPISLLTAMMETREVSGRIVFTSSWIKITTKNKCTEK